MIRYYALRSIVIVAFLSTALVLGSSEIAAQTDVKIQVKKKTNVYAGPGTSFPIIGVLERGGKVILSGISDDRNWYYFLWWDNPAWISSDADASTVLNGDVNQLPVIARVAYTPQPTRTPTSTPRPTNTPLPSATPRPQPASFTLSATGTAVIRVALIEAWFSSGTSIFEPKHNYTYLVTRVRVENLNYADPFTGSPSLSVSQFDFKILDSNGTLHSSTFDATDANCDLEFVDIIIGGKVEGCVTFEVPQRGSLNLVYAPFAYDQYEPGRYASFIIRR